MLCMYVHVEQNTCNTILPYITSSPDVSTMLDAMLPHAQNSDDCCAEEFTKHVEEVRQLARNRMRHQQRCDTTHYNLRQTHGLPSRG